MNIYLITQEKCVYIMKFIMKASLLVGIPIHFRKHIKICYQENYLNILNFFLLAYLLNLLLAKYLTIKTKRQEKDHVLFAK